MTDALIDVRAVLLSAGVSFAAVFLLIAGSGFSLGGIGGGPSIPTKYLMAESVHLLHLLTARRYTGRGFPVCVLRRSHAGWKLVCDFAIDGDAGNLATCGGRCRWRERRRDHRYCVGFGRRTRVKPGDVRMWSN